MTLKSSSPSYTSSASTTTTSGAGDYMNKVFRDTGESGASSDGTTELENVVNFRLQKSGQ